MQMVAAGKNSSHGEGRLTRVHKGVDGLIKALIESRIATIEDTIALLEQQRIAAQFRMSKDGGDTEDASLGTVNIATLPKGADILVDDALIGNGPARLRLKPGSHKIEVQKVGFQHWIRNISVLPSSEVNLNTDLAPNH